MPRHQESRALPFSAEQMYDLVVDVEKYSEFLPWIMATRIKSNTEQEMLADMIIGFGNLRESFTSRVIKSPKFEIKIDYISGPLKKLHNIWVFENEKDGGSLVHFEVEFQFKNAIFEALAGQYFHKALRKMTGAFEQRAYDLYDPK
ncbi:ubiquinone-binding protein [Sphingorhabdus lutea]|uniref:Ubiquinone-binding protein n=1 Tax=Sphingorhabdus lutea TaxID=1913578 RepID=A0A1L3JC55_9SPHN|nr:type II toxin-antitoxin system RatA family toxin [Sphingorhabdus lutea]APG62714.1 ubiquinone-binding protein [Sphingorhabdus lutea]